MAILSSRSVTWSDEVDQILAGDLTAALSYVTPAGGAVVTAVAPIGLRDREAGSVTFTTSLGFGRKLDRVRANPKVALAYHAREHGFATGNQRFVLVQGAASFSVDPDPDYIETEIQPRAQRFMGKPRRGKLFWDRWLQEYYSDRIPVTVKVERIVAWPDLGCAGEPQAFGAALPGEAAAQQPPAKGTLPRVDTDRAASASTALDHTLVAYAGADGFPDVIPVEVAGANDLGVALSSKRPLAAGGRRAGLLSHSYRAHLIGLEARQHTGWLEAGEDRLSGVYAPHTASGFKAPPNKTLLLLANGFLAKRALGKARKAGRTHS